VPGQAARHDEQGVDANVIAVTGIARREPRSGHRNAAEPIFVKRPGGRFGGASLLDLDKGQYAATPCDQVDFAARNSGAAGENPPALEAQPPGGDCLRLAAAIFRLPAVQLLPPSSNARA